MTDIRTSFPTLEISGTEVGAPLHKALEGDAILNKNAHGALVAKDPSNNFAYLRVDANGRVLMSEEGVVTCLKGNGELAAGSATIAAVTNADITLANSQLYQNVGFIVSCRRDALFQIVLEDDGVDTVIGEIIVGSGAYTVSSQLHCFSFTTGATGTQKIKILAKNFEALSSLRASITVEEVN